MLSSKSTYGHDPLLKSEGAMALQNKAHFFWVDMYIKAGSAHDFRTQVEIFYLHFLSSLWSKKENFSAHHKENFLNFQEHPLHSIIGSC